MYLTALCFHLFARKNTRHIMPASTARPTRINGIAFFAVKKYAESFENRGISSRLVYKLVTALSVYILNPIICDIFIKFSVKALLKIGSINFCAVA